MIRKTSDIVVALDDSGISRSGLDYIRINSSLNKEIDCANLLCLFFEDADELFTDNLSLTLRIGNACEFREETLFSIDAD